MNFWKLLASGFALCLAPSLGAALESYHSYTSPVSGVNQFGLSIAVSDGLLHVGGAGNYIDSKFKIYRYDLATGAYLGEVTSPNSELGDGFGTALSAANGAVLTSAPYYSSLDYRAVGAAYLLDANTGAVQQVLANPEPSAGRTGGEQFGYRVAQDGRYALVAGRYENQVSVYDLANPDCTGVAIGSPCKGTLINTLASPADTDADYHVQSPFIAIDAGRALLGDPELDAAGVSNSGGAQLFDVVSGNVLQSFVDPTPNPTGGSGFGGSVAISGDFVLIGETLHSAPGDSFVHLFSASTGALLHTFAGDDYGVSGGYFGDALAISGDYALIGSFGGYSEKGSAILLNLTDFSLVENLIGLAPETSARLGQAVALGDGYAAVSKPQAFGDADYGEYYGEVHSFALSEATAAVPAPSAAPMLMFGVATIMLSRRRRKA